MSNAANNIEARSKSLRDLLKERRYKVGYFQREYKWLRYNIEDLINDLERSFFNNYDSNHSQKDVANYDCYYMGPIVLFQEDAEFSIVDGQQRLTSFTLILIFLKHLYKELYKKDSKLDDYIYSNYYGIDSFNLNIPSRENILNKLFNNQEILESDLINESCENIFDRYEDILELFPLRLRIKEVLPLFINWLTEKLIFIEILAQSSASAYTIFETMNDRGLNLTPTEMLKSYLLSSVKDEERIRELDVAWKNKIGQLKSYSYEEDLHFFRAWFRAKYAITIRQSEKGAENEDFEKISTRFHNWVQDNNRLLFLKNSDDFYFLVKSDFQFYSDLYLKLLDYELDDKIPEHTFKLISYKGISNSLSYPFIISPIQKIDDRNAIEEKIKCTVNYLDSFAIYRLLLDQPITQSSIRYSIYNSIKEIRNLELGALKEKLAPTIVELRKVFLENIDYVPHDRSFSKYLLSRIFKYKNQDMLFEDVYFQRKKDSFILYQFLTQYDVESVVNKIPKGLKDIFIQNLCSYCIVPRQIISDLNQLKIAQRITYLIENGFILEFKDLSTFDPENLKDFFITRNKKTKELITSIWKL